jgi:hypothetical protein
MTAPTSAQSPAQTARLIHASLCLGVLLLAGVTHFVTRPSMADQAALSPTVVRALLAAALGESVRRGKITAPHSLHSRRLQDS